jgi:hypothetical protein
LIHQDAFYIQIFFGKLKIMAGIGNRRSKKFGYRQGGAFGQMVQFKLGLPDSPAFDKIGYQSHFSRRHS